MILGLLALQANCQQPSPAQLAAQAVAPTHTHFACTEPGCTKDYSNQSILTRHIKINHRKVRVECTESYGPQTFTTRHYCYTCKQDFVQKNELASHLQSAVHEQERNRQIDSLLDL